jgi:YidC/Oxa1 family membrane protein insertase
MNTQTPLANIISDILGPVISALDWVMVQIHSVVGSWGLSIIFLTILVRIALIPLTVKQIRSMQAMQRMQPEMKALQAKYKGDKQKLNEEMMKFYRENEINPLGSCLPLVAQFPVFIALFYMLRQDLKLDICPGITQYAASIHKPVSAVACGQVPGSTGQEFLFIPDLTSKATGAVLVVLIVMYVGSQLGSSLMMTSTMDKTQRNIMLAMPLVFVFFILGFPAGLIVYWITTNLWTVGQQYVVKRSSGGLKPADVAPAVLAQKTDLSKGAKGSPGDKARSADGSKQKQAQGKSTDKESADGDKKDSNKPKSKQGPPPQRGKKKRTGRRR